MVECFRCYDFNDEWYLVEMILNKASSEIDWSAIVVPDNSLDESEWQCAYMEQYLNKDGTQKICDTYCIPEPDVTPSRVVFFIYKDGSRLLRTPYGKFELESGHQIPERLRAIVEFDED